MYPKEYFKRDDIVQDDRFVFVLMPFAKTYDKVYELIKNTVEGPKFNLDCKRADEIIQPHIIESILHNIVKSGLIIIDMTSRNPNVFYELGLSHSVKDSDQIVLISQSTDDIPFDLQQYRTIIYDHSTKGLEKLSTALKETINELVGEQITAHFKKGEWITVSRRLKGERKLLYELRGRLGHLENDFCKFQLQYSECRADGSTHDLETVNYGLELNEERKLKYVYYDIKYLRLKSQELGVFSFITNR